MLLESKKLTLAVAKQPRPLGLFVIAAEAQPLLTYTHLQALGLATLPLFPGIQKWRLHLFLFPPFLLASHPFQFSSVMTESL